MHKINITGTRNLTKLCLSKYYFLYENNIRLFQNSGLIPLSIMVDLSEYYLQKYNVT